MNMVRVLAASLLFLGGAIQASATTIDFEEFAVGHGSGDPYLPFQSKGYDISGYTIDGIFDGPMAVSVITGNNGTNAFGGESGAIGQDGYGARLLMSVERTDGTAFSLQSADFYADYDIDGYAYIQGIKAGGGNVTLADAALGTGDWLNITRVDFGVSGDGFSYGYATGDVDNLVVGAAVPVPAAVWLFGSALGLLGWVRRHKANAT